MDTLPERVKILFLSFVSDNWRKFLFPIAAIAVIIAFLLIPRGQANNGQLVLSEQNPIPEENIEESPEISEPELQLPANIMVDVKGAVRHPGVYTMEVGDRLIDAVTAAGGYLPDADSRLLNHAMKLVDELLIYVPVEGEELTEREMEMTVISPQNTDADTLVNINRADERLLMTINGIGPAKAAAIINHRDEHGPFSTIESIMDVSGIGKKTFEKFEDKITVN